MSLDTRMLYSGTERTSVAGDGKLPSWVSRVSLAMTDLGKSQDSVEKPLESRRLEILEWHPSLVIVSDNLGRAELAQR